MARAALFAVTGLLWATDSLIAAADEGSRDQPIAGDWPRVLFFSAVIASFAFAIPAFARMVAGRGAVRVASVAAAGALLASVANVFEDGVGIEAAFWPFVAGAILLDLGLLVLTAIVAIRGRPRILAIVPAAFLIDILFLHAMGGGVLVLLAWLLAAAISLRPARRPMIG